MVKWICGMILALLLFATPAHAERAHTATYCGVLCAEHKAEQRYRQTYYCHHLNYICNVHVAAVIWNWFPKTWGWHQSIGSRCRYVRWINGTRILYQCHTIYGGGEIRVSDGAWVGFWGPRQ